MTGEDLQEQFGLYKRDIADVSDDDMLMFVNTVEDFLYRRLTKTNADLYIDESNEFTITTSPQTVALPSDLKNLRSVGCGFYLQNSAGAITSQQLRKAPVGYTGAGYRISGSNAIITGVNGRVTLRYVPNRTRLTSLSGELLLDESYTKEYIDAINVIYSQWDNDPSAESNAGQRYAQSLDEIFRNIGRDVAVMEVPRTIISY